MLGRPYIVILRDRHQSVVNRTVANAAKQAARGTDGFWPIRHILSASYQGSVLTVDREMTSTSTSGVTVTQHFIDKIDVTDCQSCEFVRIRDCHERDCCANGNFQCDRAISDEMFLKRRLCGISLERSMLQRTRPPRDGLNHVRVDHTTILVRGSLITQNAQEVHWAKERVSAPLYPYTVLPLILLLYSK